MHCHRFPLILIRLCMNKRPTSEVEDLPQLVFALALQNNSTLPQTKLLLADSLRRFKANLVQQIAINFDFVHWKMTQFRTAIFRNASSALWHYSEQSTNFTIKYRHNHSAVRNKSRDGGSAKDHNNAKYSSAPPANPQWGWLGTLEGTKTQFSPQTLRTTSALRLPLLTICTTS